MNTVTGEEVALKIIEKERIKADDFGESLKKEVTLTTHLGPSSPTSQTSECGSPERSAGQQL